MSDNGQQDAVLRELNRALGSKDDIQGGGWGRRSSDRPPQAIAAPDEALPAYRRYTEQEHRYEPQARTRRVVAVLEARPRPKKQGRDLVQVTASIDRVVAANFDLYVRQSGKVKQDCVQAALESWLNDQR